MKGDFHVRFCENLRVKLPWVTRLCAMPKEMKGLLTILFILTSLTVTGQSILDSLILTKEQSDKWILKVENEAKPKQLDLIRQRILLDTNIYIRQIFADGIKFDNEKARGSRTYGYGRLLLVFNGEYFVYIDNETTNKSVLELVDFLTDSKIKNVAIIKDSQATAIYGSRAVCGVLLLTTRDKKTFKQIKEVKLSAD
jgi:TonB-dependent SusC/RagA subfamily outer membrane receptor